MTQVLRGNIVQAPQLGKLDIREHGYLVLEDGAVQGVYDALPEAFASAPLTDYGDRLIMQSFADMHLHAPQYPMLGMGMDLPLLDWLNTYTFRTEARFADPDFARRTYRRLATDLITNGTTRVCMFSSLHTEATWILMEELERAGVTGFVGKVNMDRNGLPGILQETTEQSISETLRWLDGCRFDHIKPIITPRFTPSCTDELMAPWAASPGTGGCTFSPTCRKTGGRSPGSVSCTRTAPSIGRATTSSASGRTTPSWPTASTPTPGSVRPSAGPGWWWPTAPAPTSTSAAASPRCGRCCARGSG